MMLLKDNGRASIYVYLTGGTKGRLADVTNGEALLVFVLGGSNSFNGTFSTGHTILVQYI